jgi:amidase
VPFTVKENIDVEGTPTTNSLVALADAMAHRDAPVVERMRAAGGIPIGRTNLPEMGLRIHTDSALHGLTRNPWNSTRTAGGSSGGEASAIASGMSPIGLGNDIGGSLRNPAHCCGVASIKPTAGVIPWATDIPPTSLGLASQLMLVEGVLARRISDVRMGFDIVRGAHVRDPFSVDAQLADVDRNRPLRIALCAEYPDGRTDPDIASVVEKAGSVLEGLGHRVDVAAPPDVEQAVQLWSSVLNAELSVMFELLRSVMSPESFRFLEFGQQEFPPVDQSELVLMHGRRFALASQWSQWFDDYDVMISPTWALPAFEHGFDIAGIEQARVVLETFRPALPANLFGSPAAVVPAGTADGLPVGVQVGSWRFRDQLCLSVAQMIDDAIGISTPIDPRT